MAIEIRIRPLVAEYEKQANSRLTYRELAAQTGISLSTISAMMNSRQKRVDLNIIESLCGFFDCEPGDILKLVKQPETG